MILQLADRFLKPDDKSYWRDFGWVAHPAAVANNELDKEMVANRYKLEIIGGVVDETLSYEYDEFAVVRYKRKLYLFETSGCSCPDPTETWSVQGPYTKKELHDEIKKGNYSGYTLPKHLEEDLLKVIDAA